MRCLIGWWSKGGMSWRTSWLIVAVVIDVMWWMIKIMSLVSALQMLSNSSRNNAAGSRTQNKKSWRSLSGTKLPRTKVDPERHQYSGLAGKTSSYY